MKAKSESEVLRRVRLFTTPWTAAHQAPPSMGFSRQEYWSGVPLPSPKLRINDKKSFYKQLNYPFSLTFEGKYLCRAIVISGRKTKPPRPDSPATTPNISVKKKNKDGKGKYYYCNFLIIFIDQVTLIALKYLHTVSRNH